MNIILGISGGIAAYKTPDLVRKLVKADHQVQVVMTHSAHQFVAPLALQAVSGGEVRGAMFDAQVESAMDHIELARWADTILIAPATAHVIAQLACGLAGDLLSTLCLAARRPWYWHQP
jgi:phosphopantothenoylcysteine decarboxylase/phosphopantothenate--cysteine ligase